MSNQDVMLAALRDIDLRTVQARLACRLVKMKDRPAFLLGELERIQTVALKAINAVECSPHQPMEVEA